MADLIGQRALIRNPALAQLEFLVGEWRTTGTHPAVPGKSLPGVASFAWHEGGAFLVMRTHVEEPGFPDGIAIIGSDAGSGDYVMSYFDERGVSRIYTVFVGDGEVRWFRDDPEIAQEVTLRAEPDGTLVGTGRISQNGGPWGDDLSQVFERD